MEAKVVPGKTYKVLHDYIKQRENEISVQKFDLLFACLGKGVCVWRA